MYLQCLCTYSDSLNNAESHFFVLNLHQNHSRDLNCSTEWLTGYFSTIMTTLRWGIINGALFSQLLAPVETTIVVLVVETKVASHSADHQHATLMSPNQGVTTACGSSNFAGWLTGYFSTIRTTLGWDSGALLMENS